MEDSPVFADNPTVPTNSRIPLGMSSFGNNERQQLGQNLKLAMACIEGSVEPARTKAMPADEADIRQRLKALSQDITSHHADLLELLVRFDELQGWKSGGASHCAAWMNLEIGISLQLGWEYLRVGRKLRSLPTTTALFRAGKLSWSKIRLIVNVATEENERALCHAALDASVSDVKSLCNGYRWKDDNENGDSENERALKQWESRTLKWDEVSHGATRIQLILPPEVAQAFLNSVEHSMNQLEDPDADSKISQRRADAAVRMAETSLQAAGRDIATADRYQVVLSVNASDLAVSKNAQGSKADNGYPETPIKRPVVTGAGAIAIETARRIACDCSITKNSVKNGEPVDIGRKSRLWTNAQTRAIKDRDQHCQWPGCSHTRNLKIHHIIHWADGGPTSIENSACVCQFHHTMVHEGGYSMQRIDDNERYADELFTLQQRSSDAGMFNFERDLRNDRSAFNQTRQLMPTRYRFRVVDPKGRDIRERRSANSDNSHLSSTGHDVYHENRGDQAAVKDDLQYPTTSRHSTRIECNEPIPSTYHCSVSTNCYRHRIKGSHQDQHFDSKDNLNSTQFPKNTGCLTTEVRCRC